MAQWPSLLGTEGVGEEQGGEWIDRGITFTQSLPIGSRCSAFWDVSLQGLQEKRRSLGCGLGQASYPQASLQVLR